MKRRGIGVVILTLSLGITACTGKDTQTTVETQTPEVEIQEEAETDYVDKKDRSEEGWNLIWNDEFEGDSLDTTKWAFQLGTGAEYGLDGWGNAELEYYTDRAENLKLEDGKLIITAIKEEKPYEGKNYTSARIRTVTDDETLFATTYGRVEARLKLPVGEGLWPAFWMLPVDDTIYGGWAASGEIDIMEARGRLPEVTNGTLHYGKVWPNNTYKGGEFTFADGTDISDFHVYSLEWEPDEIRWYVDDECFYTMDNWFSQGKYNATDYTKPAPYDVPFYILLNLAVGGNFDSEADVSKAQMPASMEVDFVRVYEKEGGYEEALNKVQTVIVENKDNDGYDTYAASYEDGEFMEDTTFTTLNTEAIHDTDNGIKPDIKDWQFAVGSFGGAATAATEEIDGTTYAKVDITSPGNQNYAVQLIQHLPLIEGYTYLVSFDAKASDNRTIVVAPGGDADNAWSKYFSYDASLGTEIENYTFTFKMNSATDPTARLEFNLGLTQSTVWIGNVSVTLVVSESGINDDMKKTPLAGGNLIYNGTFDQGLQRLSYWHTQDMEITVPQTEVLADGSVGYRRVANIKATGEAPLMYQNGIQIVQSQDYYLRMFVLGDKAATFKVKLTDEAGKTYYLDETFEYQPGEEVKAEFTFTTTDSQIDENAVFSIEFEEGSEICIDDIKLIKKM